MKYVSITTWLALVLVTLVSCSSPQEKAKKELAAKGIEATASAFVVEATQGNSANLQLLLAAGIPVDSVGDDGSSALAQAASAGNIAVMDILLAAGADKDIRDGNGDTPLIHAVKSGKMEAVEKLIKAGARTDINNDQGDSALEVAVRNKNLPMVTTLGKAGANLDVPWLDGRTLLLHSIVSGEGSKELVEALISGGADINLADESGQTPFTAAVESNKVELVSFMVKQGANVNALLFQNSSYPALMQAVDAKSVELVRVLIEAGADVNFLDKQTLDSCLSKAVLGQQKEIVVALLKAGANVNTKNIFLETPLSRATVDPKGANQEVAEILVGAGADINAVVTENGRSLMHLAVMARDVLPDSLRFLLQKGASANVYDNEGQTPLTLAVLNDKLEAVEDLVAGGTDVNFSAMTGKKPLSIAKELDYYKIESRLKSAGAKED